MTKYERLEQGVLNAVKIAQAVGTEDFAQEQENLVRNMTADVKRREQILHDRMVNLAESILDINTFLHIELGKGATPNEVLSPGETENK